MKWPFGGPEPHSSRLVPGLWAPPAGCPRVHSGGDACSATGMPPLRRYQKSPPGEGLVREICSGLQQHKGKGLLCNIIPSRQPHADGGEGMQYSAPHVVLHGIFAVPAPKKAAAVPGLESPLGAPSIVPSADHRGHHSGRHQPPKAGSDPQGPLGSQPGEQWQSPFFQFNKTAAAAE